MYLKIFPYLLIIIPLIGFFYTPEPPASGSRQGLSELAFFLFTIPWWGTLLSIIIGVSWLSIKSKKEENEEV